MKKIFALILALAMALSLVACGGSSKQEETKPAESTTTEAPAESAEEVAEAPVEE